MTEEVAASAVAETTSDPAVRERCTKQSAQTAAMKLKCRLYHQATDLFTAENATRIINLKDIRVNKL